MSRPGYVYVLINDSMQGLVKIGKTERDPEARARELSAVSGIPTPFVVIFSHFVQNCSEVEAYVHTRLDKSRVANNREFFRSSVSEVLNIIWEAEYYIKMHGADVKPCLRYFEMAERHINFYDVTPESFEAALPFYTKAYELGCYEAYLQIGKMYICAEFYEQNYRYQKALEYLREGIKKGDARCWAAAAIVFLHSRPDEWNRCWKNYFQSKCYRRNDGSESVLYAWDYIVECYNRRVMISYTEYLLPLKWEIIRYGTMLVRGLKITSEPTSGQEPEKWFLKAIEYEKALAKFQNELFKELES